MAQIRSTVGAHSIEGTLTIRLIPPIESAVGWEWTSSFLTIGPFIGIVAMIVLRRSPDRDRLAGGIG